MFRTSHISSFSSVIISKITSPLTKSGVLKSVCEIMCAHMPRWNGLGVAVTRSMKFERHHRSHQLKHISPAQPCKFTQTDTKKKQFTNRTNVLRQFKPLLPECVTRSDCETSQGARLKKGLATCSWEKYKAPALLLLLSMRPHWAP